MDGKGSLSWQYVLRLKNRPHPNLPPSEGEGTRAHRKEGSFY